MHLGLEYSNKETILYYKENSYHVAKMSGGHIKNLTYSSYRERKDGLALRVSAGNRKNIIHSKGPYPIELFAIG